MERVLSVDTSLSLSHPVIPLTVIAGYIEGNIEELPLPSSPASHTTLISEIFYLLADDALKSSEYL